MKGRLHDAQGNDSSNYIPVTWVINEFYVALYTVLYMYGESQSHFHLSGSAVLEGKLPTCIHTAHTSTWHVRARTLHSAVPNSTVVYGDTMLACGSCCSLPPCSIRWSCLSLPPGLTGVPHVPSPVAVPAVDVVLLPLPDVQLGLMCVCVWQNGPLFAWIFARCRRETRENPFTSLEASYERATHKVRSC